MDIKLIICAALGHSKIVTSCFGYICCARCDTQLGDTLGGCYSIRDIVIVGHACDTCRTNYAKLSWKDKIFTINPKVEG